MHISALLERFDGVKSTGPNRWSCKCSAHNDKSPSMHISVADDGRVLINCKAGCDTYSILQAVGLDWDAVFPDSVISHHVPPVKKAIYPSEALALLEYEARVVMGAAYLMMKRELTGGDFAELHEAMQRINRVLEVTK